MFNNLRYDINSIMKRDPAARNPVEVFLLYSGFHAVMWHRIASWFYRHDMKFMARFVSQLNRFLTGVEIHPAATIGRGLLIDHGMGVVIGETAVIGDNCTIYQCVTLGGTGKETGKRHPTLGNNVMVGSGAKVLGPLNIGNNSKIAAGAVVLCDVPPNSTAVGIPARIVRRDGEAVVQEFDLDQVHISDPVTQQLCTMSVQLTKLQKELDELKNKQND